MSCEKPTDHAVCIPYPVQSHINAMLKVAKLLHHRGFHITFVHTQFNRRRILKSRGPHALHGLPDFQFAAIPDGMPDSGADASQDLASLSGSTSATCFAPFCALISNLNPPVSCVVTDGCMSFTIEAAKEFGIPIAVFWPISAGSFMAFMHYGQLVERGITPLKDESYLTNGYLDTTIDWIPGMNNIRLKDLPTYIRTTNPHDFLLNFLIHETDATRKASAVILNTFDALEQDILDALSSFLPFVYTVGPLHLLAGQIHDEKLDAMAANLWTEKSECIDWLDSREPNSVIYVNFGSLTVITRHQLTEFAYGLENSGKPFLWIIRPDLVEGDAADLPVDFVEKTRERGMIAEWCSQEEVLKHPSVGGFLTHCGWNSTMESMIGGVPMVLWPFSGDQLTVSRYCSVEWGVGMEMESESESEVKREEVERCVKEVMEGEKRRVMKKKVMELKSKAQESCRKGGSSYQNIDRLIVEILRRK